MKMTLLDDVEFVYFSVACITEDNTICTDCAFCKNRQFCGMIEDLLHSLVKHYNKDINNYIV